MVLYRPLTTADNKTEFLKTNLVQLLEDQLENRLQTQLPPFFPFATTGSISFGVLPLLRAVFSQPCSRDNRLPQHARIRNLQNWTREVDAL